MKTIVLESTENDAHKAILTYSFNTSLLSVIDTHEGASKYLSNEDKKVLAYALLDSIPQEEKYERTRARIYGV